MKYKKYTIGWALNRELNEENKIRQIAKKIGTVLLAILAVGFMIYSSWFSPWKNLLF